MSEYTIDAESDAVTLASGDEVDIYQASSGRIKKGTLLEVQAFLQGASSLSGTVTVSNNVATLSKLFGVITTDSLTQTGQATAYVATVTNTTITVGDILLATLTPGTNTTGIPVLTKATAGAGIMTFNIQNAATTATAAFAGTFVISYAVVKK